ncbi:MAG: DUF2934 domain-containing protein, partial [Gammaproteobacteria bacterium]|nr:DUF2934 domain-containing protein [Gammaproteobacteria bacterium]
RTRLIMANTTTKSSTTRSNKTSQSKAPPTSLATPRKARTKASVKAPAKAKEISPDLRQQMIAEAAYLRAEQRNFSPGDPLDDWLVAEREVDLLLIERAPQVQQ